MKKTILFINGIIYIICFIINVSNLFLSNFNYDTLILIFFSVLCLIPIYLINEKKHLKRATTTLCFINLIQAFSFIFFGFTYKLLIGPDLSAYFINSGDFIVEYSAKVFNIYAYFNYVKGGKVFAIGFNSIHIFFFLYYYFEIKKQSKA